MVLTLDGAADAAGAWFIQTETTCSLATPPTSHFSGKSPQTLRHLDEDSSALRSDLSPGHFGISAKLSGQFGPPKQCQNVSGPKCPVTQSAFSETQA